MHKFEVKKCDVMTQHNPDYFHRQEKNRDWLLMCFQTPFQYYKDGKMIEGKPGDCLLNSPDKYIEHGPTEKMSVGFQNDWMYFDGEDIEDAIFNYGIPIDLLSCSAFPVNEIAFKTVFSSVHHFSYTFKKYVGVSPVAYRKSNDFFA